MSVTVVNVGYRSTNYWVASAGRARLLVDLGWPGSLGLKKARLDRMGVAMSELRYGLATHYHIDHAGLAQELKELGVPLLVLESQVSAIPLMKRHTKPRDRYVEIALFDNVVIPFHESRRRLAEIGIAGEVVPTPGHSDDSVSLVLDEGMAFTGDLPPLTMVEAGSEGAVAASWRRLQALGVTTVYPGHGAAWPLSQTDSAAFSPAS